MNNKKLPECPEEGRLPIDLYETEDEIVLRTVVAGVDQNEIDISINNDMVTIRGERKEPEIVGNDDYIKHECYWGTFSRTCVLPSNVDIDNAAANFDDKGVLIIRFPKKGDK